MSSPFITDDKTRIVHPDDELGADGQPMPENEQRFLTIRAKMDYGTRAKLNNLAVKTEKQEGACSTDQYQLFLLEVNLLGWGGPGYFGIALMPQNVHRLNPNDALVVKAIETIMEANQPEESPDPKLESEPAATEPSSQEAAAIGSNIDGEMSVQEN